MNIKNEILLIKMWRQNYSLDCLKIRDKIECGSRSRGTWRLCRHVGSFAIGNMIWWGPPQAEHMAVTCLLFHVAPPWRSQPHLVVPSWPLIMVVRLKLWPFRSPAVIWPLYSIPIYRKKTFIIFNIYIYSL